MVVGEKHVSVFDIRKSTLTVTLTLGEKHVSVFDIGGGTTDVTVMSISEGTSTLTLTLTP